MQAVVQEIIDSVGLAAALEIVRGWGGRELSVPKRIRTGEDYEHGLVFAIGLERAIALTKTHGGQRLRIPLEHNVLLDIRNQQIVAAAQAGTSITKIGLKYGLTRSAVTKILRKLNATARDAS